MQDFMTRTALNEANARLLPQYNKDTQNLKIQTAVSNNEANIPLIQDSRTVDPLFSKDRLWNLIFCMLSICGWQLTLLLDDKNFSFITSWLTIIGVPLIVRHCSKTIFIKDGIFLNSEGKELDAQNCLPNSFFVIVSTVGFTMLIGTILDKGSYVSDTIGFFVFITIIFAVPTAFFIFKNCPISILFNYKFWVWKTRHNTLNFTSTNSRYHSNTSSTSYSKSSDYYYNPSYSSSVANIYHESHRRR